MAQTKTKTKTSAKKTRASSSAKTSKAKAKKPAQSKPAKKPAQSKPAQSNGNGAHPVSKAKIPLLAGGAAVVGTVGGIALGASRSGDKLLGVKLPKPKRVQLRTKDLSKVAKEVGRFGENVGELTAELKHAREGLANGEGKHNSPIEVLLNGLTSRR
jgi:hypothetical protein